MVVFREHGQTLAGSPAHVQMADRYTHQPMWLCPRRPAAMLLPTAGGRGGWATRQWTLSASHGWKQQPEPPEGSSSRPRAKTNHRSRTIRMTVLQDARLWPRPLIVHQPSRPMMPRSSVASSAGRLGEARREQASPKWPGFQSADSRIRRHGMNNRAGDPVCGSDAVDWTVVGDGILGHARMSRIPLQHHGQPACVVDGFDPA